MKVFSFLRVLPLDFNFELILAFRFLVRIYIDDLWIWKIFIWHSFQADRYYRFAHLYDFFVLYERYLEYFLAEPVAYVFLNRESSDIGLVQSVRKVMRWLDTGCFFKTQLN